MKLFQSFFLSLFATLSITEGFTTQIQNTQRKNVITQLNLASLESSSILLTLSSPILSNGLSSEAPSIASELMGDASHIGDFLNSDFSETPMALPALAIASRVICMVADYLPDHNILPLEFAYHSIMLAAASASIFQTVKDIVATRDSSLTIQDQRCFVSLFRPSGFSWVQYKQLRDAGVFEWKELTPGSAIESANQMHWLQSGSVKVKSEGHSVQTVSSKSRHLFGNLEASSTIIAGNEGAKVLQIDTVKLKELSERDQTLKSSVRSMLLKGMQDNIAALMI